MQTKIKNALIVLVLVSGGIFTHTFIRSFIYDMSGNGSGIGIAGIEVNTDRESRSNAPNERLESVSSEDFPSAVAIPSIGVNAKVVRVGINETGDMATPKLFKDVGWYSLGTVPGDTGSAIFAGHLDNGAGLAGVFSRLNEAVVGDEVAVSMNSGKTSKFMVTNIAVYDYQDPSAKLVIEESGGRTIQLITCTGPWLQSEKTYKERLVVTAVRVE